MQKKSPPPPPTTTGGTGGTGGTSPSTGSSGSGSGNTTTGGNVGGSVGGRIKGAAGVIHGAGEQFRGSILTAIDAAAGRQPSPAEEVVQRGRMEIEQGMADLRGRPRTSETSPRAGTGTGAAPAPAPAGGGETGKVGNTTTDSRPPAHSQVD
ncbi:hypothetical protein AX17_001533 [Amanita inopinata Kibby_2008]|nr:hypothetical protein AX17_001533 [Amanita inopinata Kibby_2008]